MRPLELVPIIPVPFEKLENQLNVTGFRESAYMDSKVLSKDSHLLDGSSLEMSATVMCCTNILASGRSETLRLLFGMISFFDKWWNLKEYRWQRNCKGWTVTELWPLHITCLRKVAFVIAMPHCLSLATGWESLACRWEWLNRRREWLVTRGEWVARWKLGLASGREWLPKR